MRTVYLVIAPGYTDFFSYLSGVCLTEKETIEYNLKYLNIIASFGCFTCSY